MKLRFFFLSFVICVLVGTWRLCGQVSFTDANWTSLGSRPGPDQPIAAIAVDTNAGLTYVGGSFATIGTNFISDVAMWNGTNWSGLGSGVDGRITALALDHSGKLFAAGAFTNAGGVLAVHIAEWNGSNWIALSTGLDGGVDSLAVDSGGNLYAGGQFETAGGVAASGVACWNGSVWSPLGLGAVGVFRLIHALAFDDSGNLYAAGLFTNIGGISANSIAEWNGISWAALGSGLNATASALTLDDKGNLWVGGSFTRAGGVAANYIAQWNGSVWTPMGPGMNSNVTALATDNAGRLYAGGSFTLSGGAAQNRMAVWDGTNWDSVGLGMNNSVLALAFDRDGRLYAGGSFSMAGDIGASGLAKWDGQTWSALAPDIGPNGSVNALLTDASGNLYAAGGFATIDGIPANNVAKRSGGKWITLGTGINGLVSTLALDNSRHLYVGGSFTTAGGAPANSIAEWDGTSWSALGQGMSGSISFGGAIHVLPPGRNYTVNAVALDGSGNLYAGGNFTNAGGATAYCIAVWNGVSWSQVGAGLDNPVNALAFDGALYAGGSLPTLSYYLGAPYGNTHVAVYTWSGWAPMPDLNDAESFNVDSKGRLYVGGGDVMVEWTASGWVSCSGLYGAYGLLAPDASALVTDSSGALYAAGAFTMAGGIPANCIARWNGTNWDAMGSGVNGQINALALDPAGNLYVGGSFSVAGTNVSTYLARARVGPSILVRQPAGNSLSNGFNAVNFGTVNVGSSVTQTFVLSNIFNDALVISNCGFSSAGPNDFSVTTPLPVGIPAGSNYDLTIAFAPQANGPRSAFLQITNNSPFDDPFVIALAGFGQTPTVTTLSAPPVNYGDPVAITATVLPRPDGGTVQFYDDGLPLDAPVAVTNGMAVFPPSALALGNHLLTASFSGTGAYAPSLTVDIVTQRVNPRPVDLVGSRVYDGTYWISASLLTIVNVVPGDDVFLTPGAAIISNPAVGVEPLYETGTLGLGGAQAAAYTLVDTTGSITITPQPPGIGGFVRQSGALEITFSGTPGSLYTVQNSKDLIQWFNLSTNTCGDNGLWSTTNSIENSNEFFRAVFP